MYFLSMIGVILMTVVMCWCTMGLNGNYAVRYLDFNAILFFVLFLIPLLLSAGLLKDLQNAFRLGIGRKKAENLTELKRAGEAVSLTIKVVLVLSVFICAVQGVYVIYNMTDLAHLGPSFSVVLLSMVYGMGIALVLFPLQARINVKIQEFISEK